MIKDIEGCVQKWRCWLFYAYRLYTHRPADCVFAQRILTHFDFVFLQYTKSPLYEKGSLSLTSFTHTQTYAFVIRYTDSLQWFIFPVWNGVFVNSFKWLPFQTLCGFTPFLSKPDRHSMCSVCMCRKEKKSLLYRRECAPIHAHRHTLGFHVLWRPSTDIMLFYTVQTVHSISLH